MTRGASDLISRAIRTAIQSLCIVALMRAAVARSAPTMEEITRSFNQNMDQEPDYSKLIPWLFGAAGAVAVVMYFRQRQKSQAVPKALNHPGKLIREVIRVIEIDPAEIKRLKTLAEEHDCSSPLTLLLCPSLLQKKAQGTAPSDSVQPEQSS